MTTALTVVEEKWPDACRGINETFAAPSRTLTRPGASGHPWRCPSYALRYARMVDAMGDAWARVELYRWQHAELPPDDGSAKRLDVPAALHAGAGLLRHPETCPSTFNVAQVLHEVARELDQMRADLANANERATEWEGIAAGRLAALEDARARVAVLDAELDKRLGHIDGWIRDLNTASEESRARQERIILLEKTLRFITRIDKTPIYGCGGTKADRDRNGQLPKAAGTRWLTPREMVKNLKLLAADRGGA